MKNTEVEFKYRALIPLSEFKEFCESRDPLSFVQVSGYDHFYSNGSSPDTFYRHRITAIGNQLTFKRKRDADNSFIRDEHNIELDKSTGVGSVEHLCGAMGYSKDTTVYKSCFVYTYDYYVLSYYICYNEDLMELDRFVEIEMREDFNWVSENAAWVELVTLEKLIGPALRVSKSDRESKSLFEMYRKAKND